MTNLLQKKGLASCTEILALTLGMALGLGACASRDALRGTQARVPSAEVRAGTLERSIRVTGSTEAEHGVMLRAPYLRGARTRGGARDWDLVLTNLAEPGRRVREGDIVAVFDNVNMRTRLDDLDAERADLDGRLRRLEADQAAGRETHDQQIRVAQAAVEQAKLDLQTAPVRSRIQAQIMKLALEEAQATYKSLVQETHNLETSQKADRRILELQSDRLTVEIQRARQNLDHLTVHSPISGLLVSQQIFRGSEFGEIRNGDQLRPGQPYIRIVDLRSMVVEAKVNQADAAQLRIAAPVHISFDAYPGLRLPGRVNSIGAIATGSGSRAAYVAEIPVEIQITDRDPRVIPNLSVSADVVEAKVNASAIVPLNAVFRDRPGDAPCAYVQTPSGWERRELELDQVNYTEASVRSGLSEGERVALEEPAKWTDSVDVNASTITTSAGTSTD